MNFLVVLVLGFFIGFLILLLVFALKRNKKKVVEPLSQEVLNYVQAHWVRILDMAPNNPSGAVVDVHRLLDYLMTVRGFEGTAKEKIAALQRASHADLDGLSRINYLRNKIVHEFSEVSPQVAKSALMDAKITLNDLGAQV